jgi:CubicO group peptidase (beta-lactamase class C family)
MRALCLVFAIFSSLIAMGQQPDLGTIVQSEATAALSEGRIPGLSIAVLQHDNAVYAHGFGYAEVDNGVVATENTVYRINSITKAFTATAILQLQEQGKLKLDDPVSKWFPEYTRPGHDPTISQLLCHISGLANYHSPKFDKTIHEDLSPKGWVDSLNDEHLYLYEPGTNWSYSNLGYDLLGMIIERVSGKPLEEYFRANIFEPAGMKATGFCNTNRVIKGRAFSYRTDHGVLVHAESWGTYGNAADRLCSTVLDLSAFRRALESGKLISPSSLLRMHVPSQLAGGRKFDYGLGTRLGQLAGLPLIAYTGSGEEWTSAMVEWPSHHLTVIVLCNADTSRGQADHIAVAILRSIAGAEQENAADTTVPPNITQEIVGVWTPPDGKIGPMEFGLAEGHLTAHPVGAPIPPLQMVYLSNGRFSFGPNTSAEGVEFAFDLSDPPSLQTYHDGIFQMMVVRSRQH